MNPELKPVLLDLEELFCDQMKETQGNKVEKLKVKTTEEISKATGGFGIPGFKWPL